jgi:hypothetical protein
MAKEKDLILDWETGDRITLLSLQSSLVYIKQDIKEIKKKIKDGTSYPAQAQDLAYNIAMETHFAEVIKYYGG